MRDGAHFLSAQFARHGIAATFYATGYNLLEGNPTGEHFLSDPIYSNSDMAHGWGSDYWRTHPWYDEDPFGTEATHPAWYFASLTRELAASGHEIASHSFGPLYVRGVKPEQLEADLQHWKRAASALGIAVAPSFAFPWTSSNSLDERFWAVFARNVMPVLTRVYPRNLRYPYELDRITEAPRLTVFPDFYLPSKAAVLAEALGRIEETLACRGYHSLWTHPNEVVEQGGLDLWTRAIDAAAVGCTRGLWVAPVSEIALYTAATRQVSIRSKAGANHRVIENRSDRTLAGLTLTLPYRMSRILVDGRVSTDLRGDQARLPVLPPGQQMDVQYIPP